MRVRTGVPTSDVRACDVTTCRTPLGDGLGEMVELSNDRITVTFLSLGATMWQLRLRGHPAGGGVCLHHPDPGGYLDNRVYFGATPGPVANRIGGAAFTLDGVTHRLHANEGRNQLHGGPTGFARRLWEVEVPDGAGTAGDRVVFRLRRPDGEGGYPGDLDVEIAWSLHGRTLRFEWCACTSAPTPVSLTNHTYWNLAGGGTVLDHELLVPAEAVVVVDDEHIPTGALPAPAGGPFDLHRPTRIADAVDRVGADGIDHSYVRAAGWSAESPIRLADPSTGTAMLVTTSMPGVQVYTGGYLDGTAVSAGAPRFGGVCLETQHLPDAVNQPSFPSPIVRPGHPVAHWTEYEFDWPDATAP